MLEPGTKAKKARNRNLAKARFFVFCFGKFPNGQQCPRSGQPGVRLQSAGEDPFLRYEMGAIRVDGHPPSEYTHISHLDTDIAALSEAAINRAKARLHIGYGHTSHGSQLTTGMAGLVGFANGGGKGLALPADIFAFNNGGGGGALDLQEGGGLNGDCGLLPAVGTTTP